MPTDCEPWPGNTKPIPAAIAELDIVEIVLNVNEKKFWQALSYQPLAIRYNLGFQS
jgi:hypothetical protein